MKTETVKKILIVDDEVDIRDLLKFLIESSYSSIDVCSAEDGRKAIQMLQADNSIDLVFCDHKMPNCVGSEVLKYIKENCSEVKFVLMSTIQPKTEKLYDKLEVDAYLCKPFTFEDVQATIDQFGQTNSKHSAYLCIKTSFVQKFTSLDLDLFVVVSENYIKIKRKDQQIDIARELKKYQSSGINEVCIKSSDLDLFISEINKKLISENFFKKIEVSESFAFLESSIDTVKKISSELGWSLEVIQLATNNINIALSQINQEPSLKDLLEVHITPDDYFSAHSSLLAFVTIGLAKELSWNSEANNYKLALASFLHDITLSNGQLANKNNYIQAIISESQKYMNIKDYKAIYDHPNDAAKLTSSFPTINDDVDTIIRQHHERPDGRGFPEKLTPDQIHPLAALFIIAGDLVDEKFTLGDNFSLSDFYIRKKSMYDFDTFRDIFSNLNV